MSRFQPFLLIFCAGLALGLPLPAAKAAESPKVNAGANTPVPPVKIVRSPRFHLPIDCTIGTDCWVLNYPDVGLDKDGVAIDTGCNARTYEGHKGTDIMIADADAMKRGVDVVAARGGKIMRVRNSEDDHFPVSQETLDQIKADKKECGNAVLIEHDDGWQSMYCHMKKGSVIVKAGQIVKTGEKLGQVGASGMTQFPHIHIGIIHKASVIDPFTGHDITQACGADGTSLWEKSAGLSYQPLTLFTMGFGDAPPSMKAIEQTRAPKINVTKDSAALVFHAVLLGLKKDDAIALQIIDPDGQVYAQRKIRQEKDRTRQMFYVGRKTPEGAQLKQGVYKGKLVVVSSDKSGGITVNETSEIDIE